MLRCRPAFSRFASQRLGSRFQSTATPAVAPAPAPASSPLERLPSKATMFGHFEDSKAPPISEIEKTLVYPVTVIGTRKPGRFWFWAWDINVAFIRDILNPHLYLTFQDQAGRIVGPVAYKGKLTSWGPKLEIAQRNMWGFAGKWKGLQFDHIPQTIEMNRGWDAGLTVVGSIYSGPSVPRVFYLGIGQSSYGISKVTSGQFNRLPYLFVSRWGLKQWFWVLLPYLGYILSFFGGVAALNDANNALGAIPSDVFPPQETK